MGKYGEFYKGLLNSLATVLIFGVLPVHAAEVLNLTLPQTTFETAGTIRGSVALQEAVQSDLSITLVSDNPSAVPGKGVTVSAGESSALFQLEVLDNDLINGVQTATISAHAEGYDTGNASVFIQDNEEKALFLDLPDDLLEGQGTVSGAGTVSLGGIAVSDHHILLQSSDTSVASVQQVVTVRAGVSNAVFNITVGDDAVADGRQSATITASFPDFTPASATLSIGDNELDAFTVSGPSAEMPGMVPLLTTISALNIDGELISSYNGSLQLRAKSSSASSVSTAPASVTLANGQWKGGVVVSKSTDSGVQLVVADGAGQTASSATFDLFELRAKKMVTDWSLPYIYIMHRDPNPSYPDIYNYPPARFLWFNTDFEAVEQVVDPGDNALDIAVHYGENRIYLSRQTQAAVYDRSSKEVLYPLPVTSTANQVTAGRAGRLITGRGRYADLWDTESGTRLAYVYAREGGGKCSPDGRYYFYAEDGNTGTKLSKYDITGDTFVKGVSVDTRNFGSENLVLSGDGTRAFNVGAVYQTSDLQELASHAYYDDEVHAASFHGEVAVTEKEVIDSISGEALLTLPAWRSEQSAFYPDQSRLLEFDPYTAELHVVSLDTLGGGLPEPGMLPEPAVGSLCMTSLPEFSWTPMPYGVAYDVFLGTDSNAVASATTNSVEYLGRDSVPEHAVPEGTLNGNETYYWRVDIVKYGDEVITGTVWNFNTASILVDLADLFAEGISAAYTKPLSIPIDHTVATPAAWSVSCASEWLVLDATNGMAPDSLDLVVDFAALASGDHTADLVFNDGSGTFTVPFTVSVEQLRVVKMATDYEMPYIYMLHTSGSSPNPSTLFWYNTATGEIDLVLAAGENGTDLAVHLADDRIYVANGGQDETLVFDRTAQVELQPLLLGNDAYTISAGAAGRLITEGYAQYGRSVNAHVFSTSNGTSLATTSFSSGDGECSPDGRFYYHCQSKLITKYDLSQDDFTSVASETISGRWDMIVCRDGMRVCDNRVVYDADLNALMTLNDTIHAASAYGELFITQTGACNGGNGEEIYELPFATRVMALSGDQSQLLLFNSTSGSLTSLATSAIMPIPDAALEPVPAIGSVHGANLPSLSWTGSSSAAGYDVYLGTDADAVATNGTDGAEYLGRFTETELVLLDGILTGNQTYYWRVDMVGFGNTVVSGNVWSFGTSSIAIDPYRIEVGAVAAAYTQQVEIAIQNSVGAPVAWTVDCTNEWVQLGAPGGTGSATLDIGIDISGLEPGIHSAEVVFDDGGHLMIVPIELTVETMRIVQMETDWTLPYVYMVHASATDPYSSLLIWYNTATETIEQALDAGYNATDLAVHYGDNRIYVCNWGYESTKVFDRSTKQEFEPIPVNCSSISASLPGRIIGNDLNLCDTDTGASLYSHGSYGDVGQTSLDGRIYFNGDGDRLYKFTVSSNKLSYVKGLDTTYYNYGNVVVSMDGKRASQGKIVCTDDLTELFQLDWPALAISAYGDLLVTYRKDWYSPWYRAETKVVNGVTGEDVFTFPFASPAMAFSADQSKLFLFNETDASISAISTSVFMPLPEPTMVPVPADGSVLRPTIENLSWSMAPGALYYDVYLGTDSNAVSIAGTNAVEYLGRFDLPTLALTNGQLSGSETYSWRVDAVRFGNDVVQGDVWGFRTTSFAVVPNELSAVGMAAAYTQPVSMSVTGMVAGTVDWTVSSTNDWVVFAQTNGTTSGTLDVGVDMGRLAPGIHTANLIFSDGFDTLEVPLTVDVEALRVVKMVTDYEEPYIYMVHTSATSPYQSRLIWYNTDTEAVEQVRDAGLNADNLTVHYLDDLIYINNSGTTKQVFDRSAKETLEPLVLANSQNGISAAGAGQVVVENSSSYTRIGLLDTVDGSELSYYYWVRQGDGECTSDGRFYYHVESDGSSSSDLFKFSIGSNTISYVSETTTKGIGWGDYGVVVSLDGQRIYTHQLIFDAEMNKLLDLGAEVHAASAYGDLVVAESAAYDGNTGQEVYTLPFTSSVMAFSGDQSSLVLFDPDAGALTNINTVSIMPLPELGMQPEPASGGLHDAAIEELSWTAFPFALGYEVFFGMDSNAVSAATTNSPEYIGYSASDSIVLPPGLLTGAETYYWRVEAISGQGGVNQGPVWNFNTAAFSVAPHQLQVDGVVASYTQQVSFAVSSAVAGSVAWTADCTNDWVQLGATQGLTPDVLQVGCDLSGLAAGIHEATILISDSSTVMPVTISLEVHDLEIVKMKTDWMRPYIYMLTRSSISPYKSQLVWYNTDSESIEHVLDAGENAYDLTVHYAEDRIYASNYQNEKTRVFDCATRQALEPLLLGSDLYHVSAGQRGRLYSEGTYNSYVDLRAYDTVTGETLATLRPRKGGGECSLDGRFYYHSGYGSSSAALAKYDVTADTFEKVVSVRSAEYYGSPNVVVSGDGERVFSAKTAYQSSDLRVLESLGDELYCSDFYGRYVTTESKLIDVDSNVSALTLPVESSILAFASDQSKLFLFDSGNKTLVRQDLDGVSGISAPGLNPLISSGALLTGTPTALEWTKAPLAFTYDVYLGDDPNTVATATTNDASYLGRTSDERMGLPPGALQQGQTYFWRVDAFGSDGVLYSGVWGFTVGRVAFEPRSISTAIFNMAGLTTKTISIDVLNESDSWQVQSMPAWLSTATTSGTGDATVELEISKAQLVSGVNGGEIMVSSGGDSYAIPVTVNRLQETILCMEPHPVEPKLYAVSYEEGQTESYLLELSVNPLKAERILALPKRVTDIDIDAAGSTLYSIGFHDGIISRIDLDTFSIVDSSLPPIMEKYSTTVQDTMDILHFHLECGPDGILFYTDAAWSPQVHVYDYTNETHLSSTDLDGYGAGDIVYNEADQQLYGWKMIGWSAGNSGSGIVQFGYDAGQLNMILQSTADLRAPLDAPILLVDGGASVICKKRRLDTAGLADLETSFNGNIYSAAPNGLWAAGASSVYNASDGLDLASLPVSSQMQTFLSDNNSIVWYDESSRSLGQTTLADLGVTPSTAVASTAAYTTWKSTYFPNAVMAADADGDFDGQSNLDEYIAGTDPTSQDSYFVVHAVEPLSGGGIVVSWDAVTGRVYQVYWSPSLGVEFQPLEPTVSYPQNSYTDRVERVEQSGFYRVGVELE